jgi:hypothetical protein
VLTGAAQEGRLPISSVRVSSFPGIRVSAVVNHCQHKDFVCCILIKNVMMEAVERKPANIVKMYDASVREASEEAERPLEFSIELHAQANPLLIVIVNRAVDVGHGLWMEIIL